MLIDARELPPGAVLETDVCIVGAGAAGITIARELRHLPFQVTVFESGGMKYGDDTQALYQGKNVGLPYYPLDMPRLRFFGGSTNHWEGMCRPLDPLDFKYRPWVPDSGWPISKSDLDPYYLRAHEICQLGRYDYDPSGWETAKRKRLPLESGRIQTAIIQASPPTRFGDAYADDLFQAPNLRVCLHANLVEIETSSTGKEILGVRLSTLEGGNFRAKATIFVLAMGAIENARLLLASNGVHRSGIGNDHDLVGRYFMEHLKVPGGVLLPSDPEFDLGINNWRGRDDIIRESDTARGFGFLRPSPATQRQEEITNVLVFMRRASELEALKETAESISSMRSLLQQESKEYAPVDFSEHLFRVIADLDSLAIYSYRRFFRPDPSFRGIYLVFGMEQAPNAASRVSLARERDALGVLRVQLDWRITELERRSYDRIIRILAQEFGSAGLGRLKRVADSLATGWPLGLSGAAHHMGTTRMHSDPTKGVVDKHCRVHAVSNLYVAGSAVFPTVGMANPTLTIVALAIRLADHIKTVLQ